MTTSNMRTCKHCGAEIAASATTCPKCGGKNKKPLYKRPWFLILMAIVVIFAVTSIGGNDDTDTPASTTPSSTANDTPKETPQITYTAYDISTLMDDLDANALKASNTYKKLYG